MTPAARLQAAIEILEAFEASNQPLDRQLKASFAQRRYAGSKDRAAIAERVFGIMRQRAEFAWRMQGDTPRALVIASVLGDGGDPAALFTGEGYAPALLSDAERAAIAHAPSGELPLHVRGEFPAFLEAELRRAFANDAHLLSEMRALQHRAPIDLRVNTLKATRDDVLAALHAEGFDAQPTRYAPHGLRIPSGEGLAKLSRSTLFERGAFEFQDEASQIAAMLVSPKSGERILDLAAGAGGKSLALAALSHNRAEIAATDVRATALDQLRLRAKRAGAKMSIFSLSPASAGERVGVRGRRRESGIGDPGSERDGAHPIPDPRYPTSGFDAVLLDAPCSGSGTWRRQPELRWRLTPELLQERIATQDALLDEAVALVKPGGRLIYATCSILPCENEDRIAAFRVRHPDFTPLSAADIWREATHVAPPPGLAETFRATPHTTGTDGFFCAILQRA